ncbi:MAG: Uma2 family endonuclease [Rubrivivax sp.]|nr:Uma2 family endonuclease [Rubrivivax sp.]
MVGSANEAARGRAVVTCQTPLRLGSHSEPEPDLMLVQARHGGYAQRHPTAEDVLLLIKVAGTSPDYDRLVKMPLYARHGLREAWIIDIEHRQVRFFRKPRAEAYTDITATETPGVAAVEALPGVAIDLGGLLA